jgi:transketolase
MANIDELCINTIRTLSIDAVQKANSGHPGLPLGAAAMAYVLWMRHMRFNPRNPEWPDRDRFLLSAGHGCMLLYSLLHLTGYDVSMDDLKHFRQWGSHTPGHPEFGDTPGVEVTTGPLGQGLGNSVGVAMAERWLAATYNQPGHTVIDHYTYVIASDGDLMEGISAEAASLAGQLKLGRLIVLYDANFITLSATTNVTFTEDVGARFAGQGWHVQHIDGMDTAAVDAALTAARAVEDRPSLIVARTHIGYGSPKQDTYAAHGEPLGKEDVAATKRKLGFPPDRDFYIPEEALREFRKAIDKGAELEANWKKHVAAYRSAFLEQAKAFDRCLAGQLPDGWEAKLPAFTPKDGEMATRDAGGKVLNGLAAVIPNLVGGSADLDPSTRTMMKGLGDFESPLLPQADKGGPPTQGTSGGVWSYAGHNVHFGIREHAMTAVLTGMARHGGIVPFGATFLTFSDYMRPSIRLAALSKARAIYVWTHDSIALGEDGPTHQPVEHLASLRAMPNMLVVRPADATETTEAWRVALKHTAGPVGLVLTRQKLPVLDRSKLAPAAGVHKGAYVLTEVQGSSPELILIATGSEVSLALEAYQRLVNEGVRSRVVSMPSWELFEMQPQSYRDSVLPPSVRARVSVEAASPFGWERYVGLAGAIIGVNRFGASAPGNVVMREYGFTPEHVVETAKAVLSRARASASN